MDEKILKILRTYTDKFTSAQEISQKSHLSISTVVRHIHKLRDEGYNILAQPHWGYKLVAVPDRLIAQEITWRLNTKIIGKKVLSYNSVDSTNNIAFSLADQGISEGTVIFAETQRKGKGRLGRTWVSPKSKGIYCSLILRPQISPEKASVITLLAAVSCAEAIREISGFTTQIRWPNDILVNNKKICGILTELQTDNGKVKFIILGIGINVNTKSSKLPRGASSLKEELKGLKKQFSRLELARKVLCAFEQEYLCFQNKGSRSVISRWNNLSALSGRRVRVSLAQGTIEGQAQDIDQQGALIVRLDNGFKQHVVAGDVVRVR